MDSLVQPVETYGVCSKRISSTINQISDPEEKFPPSTKRFSSFRPLHVPTPTPDFLSKHIFMSTLSRYNSQLPTSL